METYFGHLNASLAADDVYAHWVPGQFKSEVDELDTPHPDASHMHPQTTPKQYS